MNTTYSSYPINYNLSVFAEKEYVPDDSMFFADRDASERLFPDLSATEYDPYSFTRFPLKAVIIFRSRKEKEIFSNETAQEILVNDLFLIKCYCGVIMVILLINS